MSRSRLVPYLFLAPFLLPFTAFFLYPLGRSFWLGSCATTAGGRPPAAGPVPRHPAGGAVPAAGAGRGRAAG